MVMVKTHDSSLFETAYFVLRDGATGDGGDIVSEANSIVSTAIPSAKKRTVVRRRHTLSFFIGLVCGALASVVSVFLMRGA